MFCLMHFCVKNKIKTFFDIFFSNYNVRIFPYITGKRNRKSMAEDINSQFRDMYVSTSNWSPSLVSQL